MTIFHVLKYTNVDWAAIPFSIRKNLMEWYIENKNTTLQGMSNGQVRKIWKEKLREALLNYEGEE
jgi:hypothetical protein